jgi:Ion channel
MATLPGTPPDAASPMLEALQRAPAAARGELGKVESLGGEVSDLSVFQHLTQVMPAADFFVGGGMLLLIVLIHAAGMRTLTNTFERRIQPLAQRPSTWKPDVLMSGVVMLMLMLHLLEIFVWSAALVYGGLVDNWRVAGFFAANTYTTVGYGNFVLPDGWHMLAPIIAMSGLFTFGWTGSVLVEIVRRCQEAKGALLKHKPARSLHSPRQGGDEES